MSFSNLGNIVALLRRATEPLKKYIIWAKQLDPINQPYLVELLYHDGTSWQPLTNGLKKRAILPTQNLIIPAEREIHFCQDCYNKGTITINTEAASDYGSGMVVSHDGILRVDGLLVNEGTIINNGLIIN